MDLVSKLENERDELKLRLDKRTLFLDEQRKEQTVSDAQLNLLYRQYMYMQKYMNILNHRIKDLDLERGQN